MREPLAADSVLVGSAARADIQPRLGLGPSRRLLRLAGDDRLVQQIQRGSEAAFEVAFERHGGAILGFCRHMLGSQEEAEDAVQHTFAAAYADLQRGGAREIALKPWLFTIARNRCRSVLRARYRALAFCEGMAFEPSVDGLIAEVERREHLKDLLRDIARLPEDQRAALLLTQLDTLRHDQVAQVLEVPPDKVKALLFQARSSLLASQRARETPCGEIREQLVTLTGAGLRRRNLRRHLRDCAGCREFEVELKGRRRMLRALRGPKAPLRLSALGRH
jgi:RNA polymerase sigma factor (sigma-70 family)